MSIGEYIQTSGLEQSHRCHIHGKRVLHPQSLDTATTTTDDDGREPRLTARSTPAAIISFIYWYLNNSLASDAICLKSTPSRVAAMWITIILPYNTVVIGNMAMANCERLLHVK